MNYKIKIKNNNICKVTMHFSITATNILIHVAIVSFYLTLFFFIFEHNFKRNIVEKQIDTVIDDFVNKSLKPLPSNRKKDVKEQINKAFQNSRYENIDDEAKKNNKNIFHKSLIFLFTFLIIVIIIAVLLGNYYKWSSKYKTFLINSTIVSLIFTAITELSFMFLISRNYTFTDPNNIKYKIIETLANNRCDSSLESNCLS
jgi:hypothetical protein